MNNLFFSLVFCLATLTANAQTGWFAQQTASKDLTSVYFVDANNGYSVGIQILISKTTDGGTTWIGDDGTFYIYRWMDINFISSSTGMVFGSKGTPGEIRKTTDSGNTWPTIFWGTLDQYIQCGQMIDNNVAIALYYDLGFGDTYQLKTTNGGVTWSSSFVLNAYILRDVSFYDGVGIAVGDNGAILRTTSYGKKWFKVRNPDKQKNNLYACYMVSSTVGYACGANATVLKTTDGGASWVLLEAGPTTSDFRGIYFITPEIGSVVGTGGQIRKTFNGGLDWGSQLSYTSVNLNDIFFIDSNIGWIVGESGIRLKTVDGGGPVEFYKINTNNVLSTEYTLYDNYPNPFNPTTKISYALSNSAFVELKVYNVLGQEIATLVNLEKPAGFYEVDFNAADLPSGLYMYRIQAGDFVQAKKMLLLK